MSFLLFVRNRFGLSDTKVKVFTNVFWAVLGKCYNLLGALVVGIVIARYLGPEQYGLMNYVISYVAIFQVFADFGLESIQIREEARNPSQRDVLIGTVLGLRLFFAVATLLLVSVVVFITESDGLSRFYILLYSISILFNTTWVFRHHFTSIVWNEYVVKTEIFRTTIGTAVKVLLLLLHASLSWFIASLLFDSFLLASGYTTSYVKKIGSITRFRFDKQLAWSLTKQSFPLLLSCAAIVVYTKIDQLMIGNMLSKAHLGIYAVAVQYSNVMVFVPTIIAQTVSPILVQIREESYVRYSLLSSQFMSITVWVCIIMACIVCMVSYPLVYFTFGSSYIYAAGALSIISFKVIGDALSQTSGQLMIIEGIQKFASLRNVIGCIVCVLCNYVLIPRYGIMGTACVSVLTVFSSGFLANLMIKSYRHIFLMQVTSLLKGWKSLINLKTIFKNDHKIVS